MGRRAGGGLALLLAMTTVLVTPRMVNPEQLSGRAAIEPAHPAPGVQTCVADVSPLESRQPSGRLVARNRSYLPCDREHRGEVFHVYDRLISPTQSPSGPPMCSESGADARSYLGIEPDPSPDRWQPRFLYGWTVIGPDERQLAAGQTWSACVLTYGVDGEKLTQSVRGVAQRGRVPTQLGSCMDGDTGLTVDEGPVSCAVAHSSEIFAELDYAELGAGADSLLGSCRDLIVRDAQRTSSIDDSGLTAEVAIVAFSDRGPHLVPSIPADEPTLTRCLVRAGDGRKLIGTLRGLGDAAIPWSN